MLKKFVETVPTKKYYALACAIIGVLICSLVAQAVATIMGEGFLVWQVILTAVINLTGGATVSRLMPHIRRNVDLSRLRERLVEVVIVCALATVMLILCTRLVDQVSGFMTTVVANVGLLIILRIMLCYQPKEEEKDEET